MNLIPASGRPQRLSPLLLAAALALAAVLPAPAAEAAAGTAQAEQEAAGHPPAYTAGPLALTYEVHAGGLHSLTVDVVADLNPKTYRLDLALRTDGWLGWMLDWSMAGGANGRVTPQGLLPVSFANESLWKGKTRSVTLTYGSGPLPEVLVLPPPEEDNRDLVPVAQQAGTIDPLSATLGMVHALASRGSCEGGAAIFDGRRRFDARGYDEGEADAPLGELSPFGGPALACRIALTPVTGFFKDPERRPEPTSLEVFFREPLPGGPPLPVRIEAETRFGAIRIHLVKVGYAAGE